MNTKTSEDRVPAPLLKGPIRQVVGGPLFALAVALSIAAVANSGSLARAEQAGHVPGQLLVKPKRGISEATLQALFAEHGTRQKEALARINVRVLDVPETTLDRVLSSLKSNPNIEYAEPNTLLSTEIMPNDPYFSLQWHLFKICAPPAWGTVTGSNGVIIAVVDTGVESTHPDLASALVPGWNFYDNNSNTADVTGHGTAVAGVAAAVGNNGIGVASVAWGCGIMPIRVSDTNGYASLSVIANALTWAADQGARVANVSFRATDSGTVSNAAQYFQSKGGVVAVAAGNERTFDSSPDNPYVLTVGATDTNDVIASFSNAGNNVDLSAPGVSIATTAVGGSYGYGTGTSFAAPVVAGVAALVISANPSLSGAEVRNVLEQTADDLGAPGWDATYGWGRVNASNAVVAAVSGTVTNPPPDTTPPAVAITAPVSGSRLAGTVSVGVSATDNVGITKLEWYVSGTLMGSSVTAPVSFLWSTTNSANGSYTLLAKAYDAAGNVGTSASVSVTVSNPVPDTIPPTVQLLSPLNGATLSGINSVNVSATDNVAVASVTWYLDSALAGSNATAIAAFTWDTTKSSNGAHTLQAFAYDTSGNVGTTAPISVAVTNALLTTAPPAATITSPSNGYTITTKNTKVYATTSSVMTVTNVVLMVDGKSYASSTSANPVFTWNTSKISKGSHTLQALAYNAVGTVGNSAVVTVYR